MRVAVPIAKEVSGKEITFGKSSTDCNIPLSLGISAITVGVNYHNGAHTREEWVDKLSMIPGLEYAIKLGLAFGEV
jgi:di/tripeptidase